MLDKPTSRNPEGVDELCRLWRFDHDERARDKLVRMYIPAIKHAAYRWGNHWKVNRDDAIQEASVGFIRALNSYDPLLASLASYAGLWMKARIGYARRAEFAMTLPADCLNDIGKVARAGHELRQRLGRRATVSEIAAEARLPVRRAENALAARAMNNLMVSVDTPILGDGSLTLGDTIAADDAGRPDTLAEEASEAAAVRAAIDAALATFVPRHQEAMRLRLIEGLHLGEVGERMGIGKERVRQIEAKALPRLREMLVGHPAVAAVLGRQPTPKEVDDETSKLLSVGEVEARTGLDRKVIAEKIGAGAFPRSVAKDNRGNRLWREAAVERWHRVTERPYA